MPRIQGPRERRRNRLSALAALSAILAVLMLCGAESFPGLSFWYVNLFKPAFTPPDWLFGFVWTVLYALMGLALWRLLRQPPEFRARRRALGYFLAQLALNIAWCWLFFGLHSPRLSLLVIYPQMLCLLFAIQASFTLDAMAAWCLVPLLMWVVFVSALNLSIWRLNV